MRGNYAGWVLEKSHLLNWGLEIVGVQQEKRMKKSEDSSKDLWDSIIRPIYTLRYEV